MDGDPFMKLLESPPFFDSWYTWIGIAVIAILAGFRSYLRGPQYFSQISLKDKVALITGGNRGIGYHTAQELANRGAKVYIACRNKELGPAAQEKLRSLTQNNEVHYLQLKLGSLSQVRQFCSEFKKKEEKLDILYCNAGVMTCPPTKTVDDFEYHLGVNYIANYVLVNELLPLLKAAAPSRIVLITSAAYALGSICYDDINQQQAAYGNGAECFSQSKLALMLMMKKLDKELQGSEVTVNACHPGVVRTDIHRYMPIRQNTFLYASTYIVCWYLMKTASDGAQTPIYLCVDDAVKSVSGKYYVDMQERALEGKAGDEAEAEKLWLFTAELIEAAEKNSQAKAGNQSELIDRPGDQSEAGEAGDQSAETKKSK